MYSLKRMYSWAITILFVWTPNSIISTDLKRSRRVLYRTIEIYEFREVISFTYAQFIFLLISILWLSILNNCFVCHRLAISWRFWTELGETFLNPPRQYVSSNEEHDIFENYFFNATSVYQRQLTRTSPGTFKVNGLHRLTQSRVYELS